MIAAGVETGSDRTRMIAAGVETGSDTGAPRELGAPFELAVRESTVGRAAMVPAVSRA